MTLSDKTDAVVKYFADRQKLECIKTAEDKMSLNLFQWGNSPKIVKIKPSEDIARFLGFKKEDLDGADYVMFILEKYAWKQAYAISCDELKLHLKEDGTGEIDITQTPVSSYRFFDLMKAHKYFIDSKA